MRHLVKGELVSFAVLVNETVPTRTAVELCSQHFPQLIMLPLALVLDSDLILHNLRVITALVLGCVLIQLEFEMMVIVLVFVEAPE